MARESKNRTGGQLIVDQLAIHGVTHVFCVPGESYLTVLDALHDSPINVTVCRHEGGAAMMAEAAGKLTRRPGIVFVTRGPGATNAAAGIHVASQDSTPLIMFVGQVSRDAIGREGFQELNYTAVFGSIAKWVIEIMDARRIPELLSRAFHIAMQGRPGPVVISLPEDMLSDLVAAHDAKPMTPVVAYPGSAQMNELREVISEARDPIVVVGGSGWTKEAVGSLVRFVEKSQLPVATSYRRQMLFPADHPNYVGDLGLGPNPRLVTRVEASDCIVLVGGRFSEVPSQSFSLVDIPEPACKLIHVHSDPAELNRVYHATIAIQATPTAFCSALDGIALPNELSRHHKVAEARKDYLDWSDPAKIVHPGSLQMGKVMSFLRERCSPQTIVCNGAGNFSLWPVRFWPYRGFGTQLAPTSGSMGYGLPAAIAAKLLNPDVLVIAFAGDGDLMMTVQEFATAVQYRLPIIVIVIDNGMFGTIRMHQEREYPGRISSTSLKNPDFAALAFACGGHGERVEHSDDFSFAFERAAESGKPTIIHCIIDAEAITPATTLNDIRQSALSARHSARASAFANRGLEK